MDKQIKPFRVVGDEETLRSLLALFGRVNSWQWRGWPPETVTLQVSGRVFGERLRRWVFTLRPVECAGSLTVLEQSGATSQFRIREAVDFSFVDRLENAIDFAGAFK